METGTEILRAVAYGFVVGEEWELGLDLHSQAAVVLTEELLASSSVVKPLGLSFLCRRPLPGCAEVPMAVAVLLEPVEDHRQLAPASQACLHLEQRAEGWDWD